MTTTTKTLRELASLGDGSPIILSLSDTFYPKDSIAQALAEFRATGLVQVPTDEGVGLVVPNTKHARSLVGKFFSRLIELSSR